MAKVLSNLRRDAFTFLMVKQFDFDLAKAEIA
jgi:hypothetical protein